MDTGTSAAIFLAGGGENIPKESWWFIDLGRMRSIAEGA
jgi:hypothetical protein